MEAQKMDYDELAKEVDDLWMELSPVNSEEDRLSYRCRLAQLLENAGWTEEEMDAETERRMDETKTRIEAFNEWHEKECLHRAEEKIARQEMPLPEEMVVYWKAHILKEAL